MNYHRPEHDIISDMLQRMDGAMLLQNRCFFGGGTAIVLKYGEYRRSLDVDFLCSDQDGYRSLRTAVTSDGPHALIPKDVKVVRDHRADGYGIRMFLEHRGMPIKFEIVREGNIDLEGGTDPQFGVPTLSASSMFATKLLANADRWADRSTASRDAIDLGMLLQHHDVVPPDALEKAFRAYGEPTVARGVVGAVNTLARRQSREHVSTVMDMARFDVRAASESLRSAATKLFPSFEFDDVESSSDDDDDDDSSPARRP